MTNQSSTSLNPAVARRALLQCTDIIIESSIDPFALARKLCAKEIISEDIYKKVRDKETKDSIEDRLDMILDHLKDRVQNNADIFTKFLNVLRELSRNDLTDIIMAKYFRLVALASISLNCNLSSLELQHKLKLKLS